MRTLLADCDEGTPQDVQQQGGADSRRNTRDVSAYVGFGRRQGGSPAPARVLGALRRRRRRRRRSHLD
ncbi:unnamed protein product [Boreogadus saida]